MKYPFLAQPALNRLNEAVQILHNMAGVKNIELLIWDAYRTLETQGVIFNRYLDEVKQKNPKLNTQQAQEKSQEFVNPPDILFPHGVGGAVDITLLIDGRVANMGTPFDSFTPQSSADWYRIHPPQTQEKIEAAQNRELLRTVMEQAGFVVLDYEWWHFEYGTKTWATKTGKEIILNKLLHPPNIESPADANRSIYFRQPVLESGVAQIFTGPLDRSDSLAHKKEGHYYGRSSQPTLENFERQFTSAMEAKHAYFTESGLAAALVAFKGLVPKNGTILYDRLIYYEIERGLMYLANQLDWRLMKADFTQLNNFADLSEHIDCFYCDNPVVN